MATFLFWNMGKKALAEPLFRLAMKHKVDVLMLAEMGLTAGAVLEILNRDGLNFECPETIAPDKDKIRIFTKFDRSRLEIRLDQELFHWTIRQLFLPEVPDILVVGVHMLSKLHTNPSEQASFCAELARSIQEIEAAVGHQRTLVVGDFNVNPFEMGMLSGLALHAEATRQVAQGRSRTVQGRERPFFYNPMWNFFGDATRGPSGTYHYAGANAERIVWNMFDQVLLRPSFLPCFSMEDLEILTTDGEDSFLDKKGVPGANQGSDHLPIVFKLDLNKLDLEA